MTDLTPRPPDPTATPARPLDPPPVRSVVAWATVALAGLVVLSGYAGAPLLAALAFAGGVVSWGWAAALGLPSPRGTSTVLAVSVAASVLAVGGTRTEPLLRWLPAALAASVLVAFGHQLLRRDGRPRLVESVTGSVLGVGVVVCGAALYPLVAVLHGDTVIAMAMAAVAADAVIQLLGRGTPLRRWLLPVGVLAGAVAALLVARLVPAIAAGEAMLVGAAAAGVAHALRVAMSGLPTANGMREQLTCAAASVLAGGLAVYVVSRTYVG